MMNWFGNKPAADRGQQAELAAQRYLSLHGLKVLQCNYRCRHGEIDIIAKDSNFLVFVEVRLRQNPRFGSGAESVTKNKQNRLVKTAQHYLSHKLKREPSCRFDVIEALVDPNGDWQLTWLQNAFQE
jgi:putative endonuclease